LLILICTYFKLKLFYICIAKIKIVLYIQVFISICETVHGKRFHRDISILAYTILWSFACSPEPSPPLPLAVLEFELWAWSASTLSVEPRLQPFCFSYFYRESLFFARGWPLILPPTLLILQACITPPSFFVDILSS
jgi:hypothetical protein